MNPIRRRPCADPGQKQVPGEWMTQKGIDSSKPVTEEASRAKLNKAHERSHHRFTGVDPAFPAQWFYGLYRALPGERILVVPVTGGLKARQTRSDLISPPPACHQQRVSDTHGFAVR